MTREQRNAHLRLLESLPRRTHELRPPPPTHHRQGWTFKPELQEEKQKEIFKLHSRGMMGKDIAVALGISPSTVSRYMVWKRA